MSTSMFTIMMAITIMILMTTSMITDIIVMTMGMSTSMTIITMIACGD